MGSGTDKVKGYANEAAGKVKQVVGKATGSEKTDAEGIAQEAKGDAQKAVGDVKEKVKNVANRAADKANKNL